MLKSLCLPGLNSSFESVFFFPFAFPFLKYVILLVTVSASSDFGFSMGAAWSAWSAWSAWYAWSPWALLGLLGLHGRCLVCLVFLVSMGAAWSAWSPWALLGLLGLGPVVEEFYFCAFTFCAQYTYNKMAGNLFFGHLFQVILELFSWMPRTVPSSVVCLLFRFNWTGPLNENSALRLRRTLYMYTYILQQFHHLLTNTRKKLTVTSCHGHCL